MAINILYEPDPMLVGQAANQIGQGELQRYQQEQAFQQQQLAEQQRQFDARNALDQQQLELARENSVFEQQVARNRDQLARRGLAMNFLGQQDELEAQFMLQDQQQRGAFARDAMGIQGRLISEAMGNQAQLAAGQSHAQGQFRQLAFQGMQADFKRVLDELPKLTPEQRNQVMGQFYRNWEPYQIPLPTEFVPEVPEWQDPNAQWQAAREIQAKHAAQGYHYILTPDDNGMPQIGRGQPAFPQTPEGIQKQHEHDEKIANIQNHSRESKQQKDLQFKELSFNQEQMHKWLANQNSLLSGIQSARNQLEDDKRADAEKRQEAKAKASLNGDTNYKEPPPTNWTEQENAIRQMEQNYLNSRPPEFSAGPQSQGRQEMPQQQSQQPQGAVTIQNAQQAAQLQSTLQPGQVVRVTTPDGRSGTIQGPPAVQENTQAAVEWLQKVLGGNQGQQSQMPPPQAPKKKFGNLDAYGPSAAWNALPEMPASISASDDGQLFIDRAQGVVWKVEAADPWEGGTKAVAYIPVSGDPADIRKLPKGTKYIRPDGVTGEA